MDDNCDKYGMVDFGNGPVEIRCTETGDHDLHRCLVEWVETDEPIIHHRVFEE